MQRLNKDLAFYSIILALSIFSIVYCFSVVGSPTYRKNKAYDKIRFDDITTLSYRVKNFYSTSRFLPTTSEDIPEFSTIVDPQNSNPYTYQKLTEDSFQICAVFATTQESKYNQGNDCIEFIASK